MMSHVKEALAFLDEKHQIDTFIEMAKVHGVSKDEKTFAAYLEPILKDMGFAIQYDDAHKNFAGNSDNMFAYWQGTAPSIPPIFFSAHMDTILSSANCKAEIRDGEIFSDGRSILGSDDRSSLSAYIEGIRAIQASGMPCGPIELLFTVNEENGLKGSLFMDMTKVKSRYGFVFDHPGDVGQVITKGCYRSRINITFRLAKGEAGGHIAEQADGPNAFNMGMEAYQNMKIGYLDNHETVVLIGTMQGGEHSAVVPGKLVMCGQVRSYSEERMRYWHQQMKSVSEAAAAKYGGIADVESIVDYKGFEISDNNPVFQCFTASAERLGIKWYPDQVLGGADTNNFRAHGLNCLTLGNGFQETHSFKEHISIKNLVNVGRMTVALVAQWYEANGGKA